MFLLETIADIENTFKVNFEVNLHVKKNSNPKNRVISNLNFKVNSIKLGEKKHNKNVVLNYQKKDLGVSEIVLLFKILENNTENDVQDDIAHDLNENSVNGIVDDVNSKMVINTDTPTNQNIVEGKILRDVVRISPKVFQRVDNMIKVNVASFAGI